MHTSQVSRRGHIALWIAAAFVMMTAVTPLCAQTTDDFFDSNVLHEIRIEIDPSNWQTLKDNYLANTYYSCDMYWRSQGRDIPIGHVGIRQRGTGSRSPIKPGLGVDITRYDSNLTFLGLKAFVLRNNSQDASMMHEIISMALLRRLGIPASREAYTRLYVNGQYVGLYTIVESIDASFLQRNFGDDAGYLYSYDYAAGDLPYFFEDRGNDPSAYTPKPFKPENHANDPDPGPIVSMIAALNRTPDGRFENAMDPYVNWSRFLSELAVESYLAEQDGILGDYGMNNYYMYRLAGSSRFDFLPWDKSNTFYDLYRSVWLHTDQNVMVKRAMTIPEFRAFYINALLKAAESGGPGNWLELEIQRLHSQILESAHADPYKLCDPDLTGTPRPCSDEEFDHSIGFMVEFARQRGSTVLQQLIDAASHSFQLTEGKSLSLTSADVGSNPVVGYASVQTDDGTTPLGLAIYNLRQNGVLVSRTATAASPLIRRGRIHALIQGNVDTGIAIANPNDAPAAISFYFSDDTGRSIGAGSVVIPAHGQISRFLREAPFNGASGFDGSFTFSSSTPVSVLALRGHQNARLEFLSSIVPVIDLDRPKAGAIIPQIAEGQGWETEVVLVNPTEAGIAGSLEFRMDGASPIVRLPYNISPGGSFRLHRSGNPSSTSTGYASVVAASGATPAAFAIVSWTEAGITAAESVIQAVSSDTAVRIYAEFGESTNTGIAVANPSDQPADVRFELGSSTATIVLPARGHFTGFINQIPGLSAPVGFTGMVRVSTASSSGICALTVLMRANERGEFLMTGLAPLNESPPSPMGFIFPNLVEGGGYSIQLILFATTPGQSLSGTVRTFEQGGQPFDFGFRP